MVIQEMEDEDNFNATQRHSMQEIPEIKLMSPARELKVVRNLL